MFKIFNTKYRFFKNKINSVQKSIWDLEFKLAKSRQIREGVRQDRDRAKEQEAQIEARLKAVADGAPCTAEEKEALESDLKVVVENSRRYEAQMQMIDNEVSGVAAEGENPGQNGIIDTMKSLTELKAMYIDYTKKL